MLRAFSTFPFFLSLSDTCKASNAYGARDAEDIEDAERAAYAQCVRSRLLQDERGLVNGEPITLQLAIHLLYR